MKKVIYPGPAIPASMAKSGHYPAHSVSLFEGENELEDAVADALLALGHVTLPGAAKPKGGPVTPPPAVPGPVGQHRGLSAAEGTSEEKKG